MNVGWLPKPCDVFHMIVWICSSKSWIIFCTKEMSHPHGAKLEWLECWGSKICSGGWRFDVVAAKLTTILAFVFVHCWMGINIWRTLAWRPWNIRTRGAPLRIWHSAAETFCRWKGIANWQTAAMNRQGWYKYTSDFCSFIFQSWGGLCWFPAVQMPVP